MTTHKVLKIGRDDGERVLVVDTVSGSKTWITLSLMPPDKPTRANLLLSVPNKDWTDTITMCHGWKLVLNDQDSGSKIVVTLLINQHRKTDQACLIFEAPESCRIWREEIAPKEYRDEERRNARSGA